MIPQPHSWRSVLSYWPDSVRRRWGNLANEYESTGIPWQEAEWRAFRFIAEDLPRWERANPAKVDSLYGSIGDFDSLLYDNEQKILYEYNLNYYSFKINSAAEFSEYMRKAKEYDDSLPVFKEPEKPKEQPKIKLESKSTDQKSSKPKRDPKSKQEIPKKPKGRHDPHTGSLFQ